MENTNPPPNDLGNSAAAPSSAVPSTLDATPGVNTPEVGSDFYGTPQNTETAPENSAMVEDTETATASSAPGQSEPAQTRPAIPGLGLLSHPDGQPANEQPAQSSANAATGSETNPSAPVDTEMDSSVQEEKVEGASGQEPKVDRDAMQVDEVAESSTAAVGNEASGMIDALGPDESENPEWEVDSSPYESSSDSSTSSDDDSSDEDDVPMLTEEERAHILMLAEAGSDDEGEGGGKAGHLRSQNEVAEDVPPIPDIKIAPETEIVYLGKVQTVIDNAVLIEANTSGEYQVLQSGSVLCSENREVIGVICDTLGRVENPLYTLMFSTADEVKERGFTKDMPTYYVVEHSTFVFTKPLQGMKGSDASNFYDEEVNEDDIEFSDDEAEAEHKRKLKQKRQERSEKRGGRSKKGPPGPSNLGRSELNNEGNGDGYNRLTRPQNYHEMMGASEAPVEGNERTSGARGGRGRGRGDRGRGGHGRDSARGRESHQAQEQQTPAYQPQGAGYAQPAYPQQQSGFMMPQPFQWPQQQPTQNAQGVAQAPQPFPFQFPFQPGLPQQNPFQPLQLGAHVNPMFLAMQQFQQQQFQQQQQQYQAQQYGQPQQAGTQPQQQSPVAPYDPANPAQGHGRNPNNGN